MLAMRITIDIEPSTKSSLPDILIGAAPWLAPLVMNLFRPSTPAPDMPDIPGMPDIMPDLSRMDPRWSDAVPLSFVSELVKPGDTVPVIIRPQRPFKGRCLHVADPGVQQAFAVMDIRVGASSQLTTAAPEGMPEGIPAYAFGDKFQRLSMDEAAPGTDLLVLVKNTSGKAATFRALMFGDTTCC